MGQFFLKSAGLCVMFAALVGCSDMTRPEFMKPRATASADPSVRLVERDVEAPEVFQRTEAGLWDGQPSLGGVWVAHAKINDPERVIIRNTDNGKFVIGTLFPRDPTISGPPFQVSSEAAATLGIAVGQTQSLNVTALRRQSADIAEQTAAPVARAENTGAPAPLAPVGFEPDSPVVAPVATPAPKPQASSLAKPFVQIGIFSIEANAKRTVTRLKGAGLPAKIIPGNSNGKAFWRVVVGPAGSTDERSRFLVKAKANGFADAYAVTN